MLMLFQGKGECCSKCEIHTNLTQNTDTIWISNKTSSGSLMCWITSSTRNEKCLSTYSILQKI